MASTAEYGVTVHLERPVEMRDGVDLATDVYRPADPATGDPLERPVPALLVRTPYDKRARERVEEVGRWYARRGYVVAIQDVRGRYGSGGEFTLLADEATDGADAVEWLADRAYCDGQVGTMGTSYMAWVQTALATRDPDGLAAMFVNQGGANAWEATVRHNGAVELRWLTWLLTFGAGFDPESLADPELQRRFAALDTRDVLASARDGSTGARNASAGARNASASTQNDSGGDPLLEGLSLLSSLPHLEESLRALLADGEDDVWDRPSLNLLAHVDEMADVPTVFAGAWYDSYAKATVDAFEAVADRKDSDQYLVMGPWTHGDQRSWTRTYAGEADFGEAAVVDHLETRLDFFDHYLKGADAWADRPPVRYFRMGTGDGGRIGGADRSDEGRVDDGGTRPSGRRTDGHDRPSPGRIDHGGEWAAADSWPLPGTEFRRYYAHADGSLSADPPTDEAAATTYEFDPRDPVPTIGGNCSSYYTFEPREESLEEYPLADRPMQSVTGRGGYDQRTRPDTFGASPPYGPLEDRSDVVTFRTPPLAEPLEVAGPIRVRLFGATDAPDTDFTAKLIDEHPPSEAFPEGFALDLADSICRGRYRSYRREADPVEPGEVYEFSMEPYPTANVFGAGHRIRLDVSSSNFPRYDVNPNTGDAPSGDRDQPSGNRDQPPGEQDSSSGEPAYRVATNTIRHDETYPTHVELPVRPRE